MPTQIQLPQAINGRKLVEIVEVSMRELPEFMVYRRENGVIVDLDARKDVDFFGLAGTLPYVEFLQCKRTLEN